MKSDVKIICLFLSIALICGLTSNLFAQDTNVDWGTASDDQVILQAIELTTPTPSNAVPAFATFYSAQHSPISPQPWPPLPANLENFNAWDLGSNIWVLDDLGYNYDAPKTPVNRAMTAMDAAGPALPGGGNGGTNSVPVPESLAPFDPGTNLWIAQETVSNGIFTGILSNTTPGVEYQLLSMDSLDCTQWVWQGEPLLATTNWVPWTLPFDPTTNFFLNALSLQDDGSGLPDWWQLKYFGTKGINPDTPDPAGDGWSDWQKFAMGISPFVWIAPPPPPNASASYNILNNTVTLTWQPSPGNVTGYTITRIGAGPAYDLTTFPTLSPTATNFVDTSPVTSFPPEQGSPSYSLQATYASGGSTYDFVPMFSSDSSVSGQIVAGPNGEILTLTSPIPPGTSGFQLIQSEWDNDFGTYSENAYDVPISSINGNVAQLPNSWFQTASSDPVYEDWYVQSINTNGNVSAPSLAGSETEKDNVQSSPPFIDGRQQLAQNLNFLLRAANTQSALGYSIVGGWYTYGEYAFSGLYDEMPTSAGESIGPYLDKFEPFEENYLYKNFVYSTTNVDQNGFMTTGLAESAGDGAYLNPPLACVFQPETTNTTIPAILDPTESQFITFYPETESDYQIIFGGGIIGYENGPDKYFGMTGGGGSWTFANPVTNWYGLPITSTLFAYNQNGTYKTSILSLNESNTNINNGGLYWQTESPQLQTTGYYFAQPWAEPLPGDPKFSVTNVTSTGLVSGFGQTSVFAGYAEQSLLNAIPNTNARYAYLGQYFEPEAYQVDATGHITSNSAGTVSPYGEFVGTEPGPVALVTMPNYGENVQGTGIVQVVKLVLDVNHDGTMDLSATGPDNTTANTPYVFWANNNVDRWDDDSPFGTPEQDDQKVGFPACTSMANTPIGDCNFTDADCNRAIPCTRDLEDFTRIWVCGLTTNLLSALPKGCAISLNWGDVQNPNPNNPTIDLFAAADPDGGLGYQTNEGIATEQIDNIHSPYIGRIGPGSNLVLNASTFANNWAGNFYIWCGVSNGTGGLNLTIANSNGTVLAQTTTYIQIEDVKQMYERWSVGDNPSLSPATNAVITTEGLPGGMLRFTYPPPQDTNTPYILLVHGWNMEPWEKDRYAEAAFKRLYWQGYQGRFGDFHWPTYTGFTTYDESETRAWQSGVGLRRKLIDLNAQYPGNVYLMAHSMGNIVAGEALRQLSTNNVVNTYIAMQAAVASHAYDPGAIERSIPALEDAGTPDVFANYYTNGAPCYFNDTAGAGTFVNFFNTNDYALSAWTTDQNLKPETDGASGYGFDSDSGVFSENYGITFLYFPVDTYTIFSRIIQARCYTVGAQLNVGGVFLNLTNYNQVNLPSVWPPDSSGHNYSDHVWHSAEFRSDYPQRWLFWDEALFQIGLKTHL